MHEAIGGKSRLVAALLLGVVIGRAQTVQDFSRYAPMYELANRLEAQYGCPVTEEGPLQEWRGEMDPVEVVKPGIEQFRPKPYTLILPKDDAVFRAPALTLEVVKDALDAYHRENPGRTRYSVLESPMGFHIVPVAAHDKAGVMGPVDSLLDTMVAVPPEMRTAAEHAEAVLKQVAGATGIPFGEVWNFDGRYAANGYVLRSGFPTREDRPNRLFKWGASEVTAREAMIDLLAGSATTVTWAMGCGPDAVQGNRQVCGLQVYPVAVGETRKDLFLDRCRKCQELMHLGAGSATTGRAQSGKICSL